jgi:hypothetical protein
MGEALVYVGLTSDKLHTVGDALESIRKYTLEDGYRQMLSWKNDTSSLKPGQVMVISLEESSQHGWVSMREKAMSVERDIMARAERVASMLSGVKDDEVYSRVARSATLPPETPDAFDPKSGL